jgi:cardiolipin synthase A/B
MSTCRVAVPVKLARLRVRIEKGRHWTAVDHLVLWALAGKPRTSQALADELHVPPRLINEIVLNLMRAGWVELAATPSGLAFRANEDGSEMVRDFDRLPAATRPVSRPLSFLVEPFQLRAYTLRDLRYYRRAEVDEIAAERDVRRVAIEGDETWGLTVTRLHDAADAILAEAGRGETLSSIDFQASFLGTEFALFTVTHDNIRGVPPNAPKELIEAIRRTAHSAPRGKPMRTRPTRLAQSDGHASRTFSMPAFGTNDILTSGRDHRDFLLATLRNARYNVIIHSTFLRTDAFADIEESLRRAARRGAKIDILWGSAKTQQSTSDTLEEAIEINKRCQADIHLRGRARVHMWCTRSHAKLLIADTGAPDRYLAVAGSCNWLYSGFNRFEMSAVFHHPGVVAGLAGELAELIFAARPSSDVAGDLNRIARALRSQPQPEGPARVLIVCGDAHSDLIYTARDNASRRIIVAADKLGIIAEARALIPLIAAAEHNPNVRGTLLYSSRARPVSPSDERALKREAEAAGIDMAVIPDRELHGKFLLWDNDNIVISSLNWPSADTSAELPQGEIGVHITSPGIAASVVQILETIWPDLFKLGSGANAEQAVVRAGGPRT